MARSDKMRRKIAAVRQNLLDTGWRPDNFGGTHLRRENAAGKQFRMKFGRGSLRFEAQVIHPATMCSRRRSTWVRLKSAPYGQLEIVDGRLTGLRA